MRVRLAASLAVLLIGSTLTAAVAAETPLAKWSGNHKLVWKLHAEGAQIYECVPGKYGELVWQLREPVATLVDGTITVGHHTAGPVWVVNGTTVTAKVTDTMAGPTTEDIPQLRLAVTNTDVSGVATVLRVNTKGGLMEGNCETVGTLRSVPYSAQYVFLAK